jgi:hypothetical protein
VVCLTFLAFLWLTYNANRESVTAKALEGLADCELGQKNGDLKSQSTLSPFVGYSVALILLAVAALVAIWFWT